MDLKPENILEIEFSRSFRGYNEDEVNEFIEEIAEAVEAAQKKRKNYSRNMKNYYRRMKNIGGK